MFRERIRPVRDRGGSRSSWNVGDMVEAKLDDDSGWWEGEIVRVDEGSESYIVHLHWDGETRALAKQNLREAWVWHGDSWMEAVDFQRQHLKTAAKGKCHKGRSALASPSDENADTCSLCNFGGKLICCDGCPAATPV